VTIADWHGCYDDGWGELIVGEAYAHPAKFSAGLIDRIYRHGLEVGWWHAGSLISDPFGGIGGGGIYAAYKGLRWLGVELEPKFVELFARNVKLHGRKWENGGMPIPVMIQGDSREFAKLVGECAAIVTSPPFVDSLAKDSKSFTPYTGPGKYEYSKETAERRKLDYGHTPGQIGNLKAGKVDGIVTSPPYAETGVTAGNAGNAMMKQTWGKGSDLAVDSGDYGQTPGQIGNTSGETYFSAMRTVYEQCLLALKRGGVMCVVVKDYVSKGKRVPLCDQTAELLECIGFESVERIRAWLVKETKHDGLFGEVVERKERKSFFRRLAEKKGSPRIDWEEVIVVCKP
jgi:DNA modification methylase